jgi:protein-tyrosine phosphatase
MKQIDIDAVRSRLAGANPIRVIFVCLGNICRSPAAEGVLRAVVEQHGVGDRWVIDSAGTYGGHSGQLPDQRMRVHARRRGYELTHRARRFTSADFDDFDLVVAMDSANARDLRDLARTVDDEAKIVPMITFVGMATRYDYVPDPYYEGAEGFELVLDLLEDGCERMCTLITPER